MSIKKLFFLAALAASGTFGASAQVQNCAVTLPSGATVDCGAMPQLDGLSSFTVQLWMFPSQWTSGATIFSRGDNFALKMDRKGKANFYVGETSLPVTGLRDGEWNQITIVCDNSEAYAVVNGSEASTKYTLSAIPTSTEAFMLGGQDFTGRLDEVRLWKTALKSDFEYFAFNTLNKWAPQWADLLAYYKMDQDLCENLVDYKAVEDEANGIHHDTNNHGILKNGAVREPVTDNLRMPYLINSAYTANERFYDRVIPADQYLLSNDIINLGIVSDKDGNLQFSTANNHGTPSGDAEALDSYEGHTGLLCVNGNGYLSCPSTMIVNEGSWAFETWVYIEEWTDGASLYCQETPDQLHGLYIGLGKYTGGETPEDVLVVRINGNNWRYPGVIETGRWMHIAVEPGGGTTASTALRIVKDGQSVSSPRAKYHDGGSSVKIEGYEGVEAKIGNGLKAKFDDTMFWGRTFTIDEFAKHSRGQVPMPSLTGTITSGGFHEVTSAWFTYDYANDPERGLGYSTHSQDEWLSIMKSAYDGYRGAHFYISVKTPRGISLDNWLGTTSIRRRVAEQLSVLSEKYDGVELDLEWTYNWTNYSKLATEIREKLPEGKKFRISTHNVSYGYPTNNMDIVDGFTFQQYGPQAIHFSYSHFVQMCNAFVSYGYPKEKIMTSYSTTTSNGSQGADIKGVKDGFFDENYVLDPSADTESHEFGGQTYFFTGPYQTYKRARYTRDNNLMGIFYWDMGNDCWDGTEENPVMGQYNLAKWCSYGLNANVDRLVTAVEVNHPSTGAVSSPLADAKDASRLMLTVVGNNIEAALTDGTPVVAVAVYSLSGQKVVGNEGAAAMVAAPGAYIVEAVSADGVRFSQKFLKR